MKKLIEMFSPRDAMEVVLVAAIACGVLGLTLQVIALALALIG
jgi:hypothetical protein